MRLFYIANMRLPTEKAHGVQIMHMCKAFSSLGHEVRLVVPWRFNRHSADPFVFYGIPRTFKIAKIPSIDLVRFGKIGFLIQYYTFVFSAAVYILVARPEVIYSRSATTLVLSRLIGFRNLIWEAHTASWNRITSRAVRTVSLVVTISSGLHDFYREHDVPESKLYVAHDAVDISEFEGAYDRQAFRDSLNIPIGRFVVEYMGKFTTMGESKGVEELFGIMGSYLTDRPEAFFLVVGLNEGDMGPARDLMARYNLSDSVVRLVPHVPRRDIPLYLRCADVLVMNYPDTPHYARIMSPLKLFEYIASSVPIVSTDLPSIREVLDDSTAFLVPPSDTDAFLSVLRSICDAPAEAQVRANAARSLARRYTWDSRAVRILKAAGME